MDWFGINNFYYRLDYVRSPFHAVFRSNRQQYTKLLSQMADCELVRLTLSDPQKFEDQNVQLPIISDSCIQLYISHKDVESRI
jgi:hypothetical protein